MTRWLLLLTLAACSPSAQLAQVCSAQGAKCVFLPGLSRTGQYQTRTGTILIDSDRCDADWPYCAWTLQHELGHASGLSSEQDANCYALQRTSMPARRAAEARLGSGWEAQCAKFP